VSNSESNLPCILIVDDDDDQLFLTRRMLERAAGRFAIVAAGGGSEAIEYLTHCCSEGGWPATQLPSLVFLDLKMPITDGFAVLSWIRNHGALHDLKVIVLTSSDDPTDVKRCMALGAHGFLVKHPSAMVIDSVLRQALGTASVTDASANATRRER
jgi:CheY-like chemotaxis protein